MQHKEYLEEHVHKTLEQMVQSLVMVKPKHPLSYMLDWLQELNGEKLSEAEKEELATLRSNLKKLRTGESPEQTETSEDEDDFIDELPQVSEAKLKTSRRSVSAEAFGEWNKKQDFEPRFIEKSLEQKARIEAILSKSFLFAALHEKDRDTVVSAMEEKKFAPGEMVINQGDDGNELFLVDSGNFKCYKVFPGKEEPTFLKNYLEGEAFGELALLYNAPRAASIEAVEESVCWVLDRGTFNHIVKDAAIKRREKYEEFLSTVSLLETIEPYERSLIAEVLKSASYNQGEYVISEGEWGDVFYLIEEGTAKATKTTKPGLPAEEVKTYGPGDYFGELALLRGEPRAANIIATSQLKCATLDRQAFSRLLGPLEDILRRNAEKYEEILKS